MVYEKSVRGYGEFNSVSRTLHFKERQVLLLMNGVRTLEELERLFARDQLSEIVSKLASHGYIQLVGSHHTLEVASKVPVSLADMTFTAIDEVKLTTIKVIVIEAVNDYLGLMGRGIKAQIEACHDEVSLKSALSIWHMAMRESKLGRESASFLMGQIYQILQNKIIGDNAARH